MYWIICAHLKGWRRGVGKEPRNWYTEVCMSARTSCSRMSERFLSQTRNLQFLEKNNNRSVYIKRVCLPSKTRKAVSVHTEVYISTWYSHSDEISKKGSFLGRGSSPTAQLAKLASHLSVRRTEIVVPTPFQLPPSIIETIIVLYWGTYVRVRALVVPGWECEKNCLSDRASYSYSYR